MTEPTALDDGEPDQLARDHRPQSRDRLAPFERAVAAGARVVTPMKDDYGWHLGRVVDPYGHHWEIGRPLGS
jgi:uncharacterized glyoxalase superfamily protein PhnB